MLCVTRARHDADKLYIVSGLTSLVNVFLHGLSDLVTLMSYSLLCDCTFIATA